MNTKRIEQYRSTFERIESTYIEYVDNFTPQKVGHNISIYAGIYNGLYSLAIEGEDNNIVLKSTSIITLNKVDFKGRKAFVFSLNDKSLLSIFITFIVDIESILEQDPNATFVQVYNRYLFWLKMFKTEAVNISENKVIGLINELNLMNNYLIPKFGVDKSISAWCGPNMQHKDFTFESGLWLETKAIKVGRKSVQITSIEQLDSKIKGYLVITQYEKTGQDNLNSIYLYKIITDIASKIEQEDLRIELFRKINLLGLGGPDIFDSSSEINKFRYIDFGTRFFSVNDEFPRLTRDALPKQISEIEYSLQLDLLEEFKRDEIEEVYNDN